MEGREGGGDGEQRHALRTVVFRQLDQGQGERQRNQRAAGETLHGAEHDHAFQVPGERAEQRGHQEAHRDHHRQAPCREQLHQPGGHRIMMISATR